MTHPSNTSTMQHQSCENSHFTPLPYLFSLLLPVFFLGCEQSNIPRSASDLQVMTVNGPIPADSMGLTLIHEHVFLDWSEVDSIDRDIWDEEEAFRVILPYLQEMKQRGVKTFLECTPAYLGRNPGLLKRLSAAGGLQILTNTGYYAARKSQHIPAHAYEMDASELAATWIKESESGIEDSGVFPGFIKIGMDSKPQLTDMDTKIVRAAARTHLATGLTIVAHTGTDTTAAQELAILAEEGVAPEAFVWTHAQNGTPEGHLRLARKGAWVSLDGMGWIQPDSATRDSSALFKYVSFLENLKEHQLLHRTLIAHDAGWYTVGEKDQSNYKPYTLIFDLLIPFLQDRGFTEADFQQLLVDNPKAAYGISVRPG